MSDRTRSYRRLHRNRPKWVGLEMVVEGFVPHPIGPTSVLFPNVFESFALYKKAVPLMGRLRIRETSGGLTQYGSVLTFKSKEDATLFKMFYEGETA